MANVTFTSPKLKKDITIYATAGDCSTLLSVAREHNIQLNFECENGECGSCAVQVSVLENKQPLGINLTEKEKTVLKLSSKISKDQIAAAETKDIPPPWRLACQFIVRNEDILVSF